MTFGGQFCKTISTPFSWCVHLFLVCCGCDTSYIVSVHIQCQASIYTLPLCCGHSWRVRLAKQETLTPPGYLVSPLVCKGSWMSTVMLYCWCFSYGASVLLYFTLSNFVTLLLHTYIPLKNIIFYKIAHPRSFIHNSLPIYISMPFVVST